MLLFEKCALCHVPFLCAIACPNNEILDSCEDGEQREIREDEPEEGEPLQIVFEEK